MATAGKKHKRSHAPEIMMTLMALMLVGMLAAVIVMMKRQKKTDVAEGTPVQIAEQTRDDSATEVTTTELTTTTETELTTTTSTEPLPPGSVTGITLTFYSATMNVGDTPIMPIVKMLPDDAKDVTEFWESSKPSVATVDEIGRITAVGAGECTIRVTSVSNPRVYAEVTVTVQGGNTSSEETTQTTTASSSGTSAAQTSSASQTGSTPQTTTVTQPDAQRTDIEVIDGITYIQGIMIVNKTYSLPSTYNPGGLTQEAQAAFNEMAAAAKKDGYTLKICSGYRSYSYQKQLYNNYVNRKGQYEADRCSARAGHSEHQTGLAMDINYAGSSFDSTPEAKWIGENCWKYGFIVRYPKGKEDITGYKYESWHVRYLGKEWAKTIYDSGLTLEEYFGITSKYAD